MCLYSKQIFHMKKWRGTMNARYTCLQPSHSTVVKLFYRIVYDAGWFVGKKDGISNSCSYSWNSRRRWNCSARNSKYSCQRSCFVAKRFVVLQCCCLWQCIVCLFLPGVFISFENCNKIAFEEPCTCSQLMMQGLFPRDTYKLVICGI